MSKNGISGFLRDYRSEHNLSREALAEILDISDSYLAALELGKRKPAYGTLMNIINTLRVSADVVLGTDGHIGKINEATELFNDLNKLDTYHRQYAIEALKLMVACFSVLPHS